jgi:hypothetical protein
VSSASLLYKFSQNYSSNTVYSRRLGSGKNYSTSSLALMISPYGIADEPYVFQIVVSVLPVDAKGSAEENFL